MATEMKGENMTSLNELRDEAYQTSDIEKAVTSKMAYNITRPYKHGGKTC